MLQWLPTGGNNVLPRARSQTCVAEVTTDKSLLTRAKAINQTLSRCCWERLLNMYDVDLDGKVATYWQPCEGWLVIWTLCTLLCDSTLPPRLCRCNTRGSKKRSATGPRHHRTSKSACKQQALFMRLRSLAQIAQYYGLFGMTHLDF